MRSTSGVPRVISQLEDIFRMHHPTKNNYCILHNEKYEKPRTKIFRRSYNVFPSPILLSPGYGYNNTPEETAPVDDNDEVIIDVNCSH